VNDCDAVDADGRGDGCYGDDDDNMKLMNSKMMMMPSSPVTKGC